MADWFVASSVPANRASLVSATIRSEFSAVQTDIADKLPTLTGNGSKIIAVNSGATALEAITSVGVAQGGTGAATLTDGGILLGSGTSAVTAMAVLADGAIVVGDGATDPVSLAAFTSSTGTLKHERGGIEADISAIANGGLVVGTGSGTMAIRSSVFTDGATGYVRRAVGGTGEDLSAIANGGMLVGNVSGGISIYAGAMTSSTGYLTHEVGGLEADISAIVDGDFIVGTGAGTLALESGATVRTSLGLGTADSPTFAGATVGTLTLADGSITDSSGAISFGNENLVTTGTIGNTGSHQILSGSLVVDSGFGVDFSATSQASGVTSELFDDCEKGAWTPILMDTSFSASEGQTYTFNAGYYIKLTDLVLFGMELHMSSLGSLTSGDDAYVGGLPFSVSSTQGKYNGIGVVGSHLSVSLAAAGVVMGFPLPGTTRMELLQGANINNTYLLDISNVTASGRIRMYGFYFTA